MGFIEDVIQEKVKRETDYLNSLTNQFDIKVVNPNADNWVNELGVSEERIEQIRKGIADLMSKSVAAAVFSSAKGVNKAEMVVRLASIAKTPTELVIAVHSGLEAMEHFAENQDKVISEFKKYMESKDPFNSETFKDKANETK